MPLSTSPLSKKSLLLTTAAMGLALAAPAASQAAEGFVGITDGSKLVEFTSDTLPGLSKPVAIDGLPQGESIVAMDAVSTRRLVALGSHGTLYSLDRVTAKAQRLADLPTGAVPARAPATVTVAPDRGSARIIASGRDVTVDLAAKTVTRNEAAPGYAAGDAGSGSSPILALDTGTDGVLRGLDTARRAIVSVDAAGVHSVRDLRDVTPKGSTTVTTASDGTQWIATELDRRGGNGPDQSRILRYDPATGKVSTSTSYLQRVVGAIAATGTVADDTAAPEVEVTVPRQTVRSAIKNRGFRVIVNTSEGGQTVASARGDSLYAFGLGTAERAGRMEITIHAKRSSIRANGGKRVKLHLAVHDNAGHVKTIDRYLRLAR